MTANGTSGQEIVGPARSIPTFASWRKAIAIANDVVHGPDGGIWTTRNRQPAPVWFHVAIGGFKLAGVSRDARRRRLKEHIEGKPAHRECRERARRVA